MKDDMRVTRTKDSLRKALLRSMKKKPLKDIRVSEIAKQASVSRKVFYDHYGDIYDLVFDCYDALCVSDVTEIRPSYFKEENDEAIWLIEHFTKQLEFFRENPQFAHVALETVLSSPYLAKLVDKGTFLAKHCLEDSYPCEDSESLPLFSKDTIARYLFFGNQFLIQDWIENGMKESASLLAQRIVYIDSCVCECCRYHTDHYADNEFLNAVIRYKPSDNQE